MAKKSFATKLKSTHIVLVDELSKELGVPKSEVIAMALEQLIAFLGKEPVSPRTPKVGDKLPLDWELKPHFTERGSIRTWYVFPRECIVAAKQKSANGSKTYLEVAKVYSQQVWEAAKLSDTFQTSPVTTLEQTLKEQQQMQAKDAHPSA